jgi:mRNA interferase HicA
MKRIDLVRHLEEQGCYLLRDKGKHSIYVNPANNQTTSVPRHREINDFLAKKICRDVGLAEEKSSG